MKRKWSTIFYIVIVAGLGFAIYWIAKQGSALQTPALKAKQLQNEKVTSDTSSLQVFTDSFKHGLTDPLAVLLLQIIVIIASARLFGYLFKKRTSKTNYSNILLYNNFKGLQHSFMLVSKL